MTSGESRARMAVDIGGTFTDLVAVDDGQLTTTKASTTPANPAEGVLDAVEKSGLDSEHVAQFVHGTTVVINAITERSGQDVALLTTDGFRDVLDITRANRPDMFNLRYEKPEPFVPRRHRWEVGGRIDAAGEVVRELSEADIEQAVEEIRAEGIETIAVAYINAYANDRHERRTRELLEAAYPEAYVTLSHELTGQYREYERTNTAVLNAYVRPVVDAYLSDLETRLADAGVDGAKYAMKSNAGTSSFEQARETPVELVESGPVGGVYGAAALGDALDEPDVISFDMGGTTAKASLVEDGEVAIETEYWVERTSNWEGYPLSVPVVDIVEIGAGGGSIGWIDDGGALNVGPESAGAEPGPACYDRGGTEPTVTDANLVTGRLDPEYFLGGEMPLDVDRARAALEPIADQFDTSVREAAHGILRVVNSSMTNALKQVSIRRGYDPREFVLVASGGAGGLHAPLLGDELGVREVVVPRVPGQFSAWGMLQTDVRRDYIRTTIMPFDTGAVEDIAALVDEMGATARTEFETEDVGERLAFDRSVDLRYAGQEHTVQTPMPGGEVTSGTIETTLDRFHQLHEQTYNFRLDDPVEVVNVRLVATHEVPSPEISPADVEEFAGDPLKAEREVDFETEGTHTTPVYERARLSPGTTRSGPAIIEEPSCTVLVYPTQECAVDEFGNLRISTHDP